MPGAPSATSDATGDQASVKTSVAFKDAVWVRLRVAKGKLPFALALKSSQTSTPSHVGTGQSAIVRRDMLFRHAREEAANRAFYLEERGGLFLRADESPRPKARRTAFRQGWK